MSGIPADRYKATGNMLFGTTKKKTRCANCKHCIAVYPNGAKCDGDVYLDGATFPRKRVYEENGVLVPKCFFYEAVDMMTPKKFREMAQNSNCG